MPLLDNTGEPPTCDLATQEDVAIDRAHAAVDDDGNKEDGEEELDKLPTVDDAELTSWILMIRCCCSASLRPRTTPVRSARLQTSTALRLMTANSTPARRTAPRRLGAGISLRDPKSAAPHGA